MRVARTFFVYLMASETRTIYIGMTNDLEKRVWQHRYGRVPGFTVRYRVTKLVYFEDFDDARDAIAREKQLKGWRRAKKLTLINSLNPDWDDLSADWGLTRDLTIPTAEQPERSPMKPTPPPSSS